MPAALNAYAQAPDDNMPVYGTAPTAPAPLTAPTSPMMASPYGGMDPMALMLAMQGYGAQTPPAEVQNLSQSSQAMLGTPQEMTGALSRLGAARDAAAQQKISSIDRAMSILSSAGAGGPDLVRLMSGSAMMGPTRTGTFGESMSNAGMATAQALQQQRELDRQRAIEQAQLVMQQGAVPGELAQQQAADFYKRIGLGQTLGEWAARAQASNAMANARLGGAAINAGARITAAQLAAGSKTGRYKLLGTTADGTGGVYLDTVTGAQSIGPAVQQHTTDFESKYAIAKELYPNDPQLAYQAAIGKREPSQQDLKIAADKLATQRLDDLIRQGQTPDDPQAFIAQTSKSYLDHWNAGEPAHSPTPAAGATPPAANAFPAHPAGVPANAQFSPSQKRWWWKSATGQWQHN